MAHLSALKGAILNRLVVVGSVLGGFGLIAVGLYLGFWDAATLLLEDPLNPDPAIEAADPVVATVLVVAGVVVWQVGKAYAQIQLSTPAGGNGGSKPTADGGSDGGAVDPDVLAEINDRLRVIETDLEETRQDVRALRDAEQTVAFDEEGRLDSDRAFTGAHARSAAREQRDPDHDAGPAEPDGDENPAAASQRSRSATRRENREGTAGFEFREAASTADDEPDTATETDDYSSDVEPADDEDERA